MLPNAESGLRDALFLRRHALANWDVDELEAKRDEIVGKNLLKVCVEIGIGLGS